LAPEDQFRWKYGHKYDNVGVDMVMSPLVCNLKTHVKDTNHALQILRTFQFAKGDASQRFLYTMDIKSLYTVIPHNSGLEALKYFLNKLL